MKWIIVVTGNNLQKIQFKNELYLKYIFKNVYIFCWINLTLSIAFPIQMHICILLMEHKSKI